jgi:eukaryotic-like serine/threonine-protein kinase
LLVRVLGQGGMGVVFEGKHAKLGQRVAIKMLLPDVLNVPSVVERFEREARAAANLRGRHVARVLDVDMSPSGLPFMVMEFLEGNDLADELAHRGPLPVEEAVAWVIQACEGMAEAHAMGIVHRDLKPANLFLAHEGKTRVLKVLDFGISKVNDSSVDLTSTYAAMGTPLYMSPEQVRSSKSVDERTDVWALSVILYELLTGRPPFFGESATAVIAAIASDDPVPLRELRPDVPRDTEAAVRVGMTKDVRGRFASVGELAAALQGLAATEPRAGGKVHPALVPVAAASVPNRGPGSAPSTDASWSAHRTGTGQKKIPLGVWLGAAVAGVGVVVGITVMALGGLNRTNGASSAEPVIASSPAVGSLAASDPAPPASAPTALAVPAASASAVRAVEDLPPAPVPQPKATPTPPSKQPSRPPPTSAPSPTPRKPPGTPQKAPDRL